MKCVRGPRSLYFTLTGAVCVGEGIRPELGGSAQATLNDYTTWNLKTKPPPPEKKRGKQTGVASFLKIDQAHCTQ